MGLILVLAGVLIGASSLLAQENENQLIVGVPVDRCPMFYRDENGEIVGIGVDLMDAAAEEAGFKLTYVELKEPTLKDSLDNAEYDVIMPFGSALKSAAGKASVVSENLIRTPFTLVTKGNDNLPPINSMKVGMLSSLGGAAETVKQLYPGIEITLYDTMNDSVRALRRGEINAILHNSYVWSYVLQKPSYKDLRVRPAAMFSMDFCVGALNTAKGQEIIKRLNEGIASIDDTKRQAIVLDYTGRRLYQYGPGDYLYEYGIYWFIGIVLFIAFCVYVFKKQSNLKRLHEEKVKELVERDSLTGVLSMDGFRKKVTELLTEHPDIPYMISYNNIRNFKYINDSLGKEAGDALLRFWAEKSSKYLSDVEAMGRAESDHFVVLRSIEGNKKLEEDDKLVFTPIRNFFLDRGKDFRVQMSSGVYVVMPEDYKNPDVDHMLDFARVAEKKVHDTKKDGYVFYNPNQWEKGKWTADVVGHLKTALDTDEIRVWYQPQVDYETGEITGAEALCRWAHTKLGCIPPSEFIPALENSGSIYELDCFVWERVCQDLHRWNEQGKHRVVSVNVSRCDIRENQELVAHFCELLRKYELTADQLRIEITESAYVEDAQLLIRMTRELKSFGFQVEMDDFGSGYSSLNMLKEVPVDRIKLDLKFLTGDGSSEQGRIIIKCMIYMAKELGMEIIAEGVETKEQGELLMEYGCSQMQGYFFYKPMAVEEFEKL